MSSSRGGVRDESGCQLGCQGPIQCSGGYEQQRRNTFRLAVLLVGDTGFEPVTSSVSGKRATAAPIARGGDGI
jgi:hypothetical protein